MSHEQDGHRSKGDSSNQQKNEEFLDVHPETSLIILSQL